MINEFKNKTEIFSAIKDIVILRNTVIRRVDCVSDEQLRQVLEICEFFSIQLEESTGICKVFRYLVLLGAVENSIFTLEDWW